MRLERVWTIKAANRYLKMKFLPPWNRRFTIEPACEADAHRPAGGLDLKMTFSIQTTRTVANDFTICHNRAMYQIRPGNVAPDRGLARSSWTST